jgi:outer membrane lipoprotein SlyB
MHEHDDHEEARDRVDTSQPGHADTGSAAGVGGVTGAAIGSLAGPLGAAVGAAGGMLVGALAERAMHVDDDARVEAAASQADVETDPGTLDG